MSSVQIFALALIGTAVGLGGCKDNGRGQLDTPSAVTVQIESDASVDGDIEQTSPTSFTTTQGMSATVQSVFVGIDPVARTEFRALLDFPLTGAGGVPGDATIDSAFLDVHINSLQPSMGSIPILIELVSIQPPILQGTDFDRSAQPPLASLLVSQPIAQSDVGNNVGIDVTPLMAEAQRLGLVDFQVRILEDLGANIPILAEINDTTAADRSSVAPLLTVSYFPR